MIRLAEAMLAKQHNQRTAGRRYLRPDVPAKPPLLLVTPEAELEDSAVHRALRA